MRRAIQTVTALFLAGCGGGATEPAKPVEPTVVALHSEPTPTEPSGIAVPTGEAARPHQLQECPGLSGSRRSLELDSLRVKGTIIGARSNVAMLADARGRTQTVRVGEFIGTRCWKVASVGAEWVSMQRETLVDAPAGDAVNLRLYVNEPPRRELAGR